MPDTLAALTVLIGIETELGRWEAAARHVDEMERDLLPGASSALAAEALWAAAGVSDRQGDEATALARLDRPRTGAASAGQRSAAAPSFDAHASPHNAAPTMRRRSPSRPATGAPCREGSPPVSHSRA
ncbi:hypothetical protein [Streptomyces albogriseolus]|uniref:hypothetical protein n=1 Tax=Streptomyces albogriseolus TaxID=1887 RepID=UPI0037B41E39